MSDNDEPSATGTSAAKPAATAPDAPFFDEADERAWREEIAWREANPDFDYGAPPTFEIEVTEDRWGAFTVSEIGDVRPAAADSERIIEGALKPSSFEVETAMFLDLRTLGRLALDLFRECHGSGLLADLLGQSDCRFDSRPLDHSAVEQRLGVRPSFRVEKPSPDSPERRAAFVSAFALLLARPGVDVEPWRQQLVAGWSEAPFDLLPAAVALEMAILLERYRSMDTNVESMAVAKHGLIEKSREGGNMRATSFRDDRAPDMARMADLLENDPNVSKAARAIARKDGLTGAEHSKRTEALRKMWIRHRKSWLGQS